MHDGQKRREDRKRKKQKRSIYLSIYLSIYHKANNYEAKLIYINNIL